MNESRKFQILLATMLLLHFGWMAARCMASPPPSGLQHWPVAVGIAIVAITVALIIPTRRLRQLNEYCSENTKRGLAWAIGLAAILMLFEAAVIVPNNAEVEMLRLAYHVRDHGLSDLLQRYDDRYWMAVQHPPTWPTTVAWAMKILPLEDGLFEARLLGMLVTCATLCVVGLLGERWLGAGCGVPTICACLGFRYFLQFSADAHSNMISVLVASILFLAPGGQERPWRNGLVLGAAAGLGILFRYPTVFVLPGRIALDFLTKSRGILPTWSTAALLAGAIVAPWFIIANQQELPSGETILQSQFFTLSNFSSPPADDIPFWEQWKVKRALRMIAVELPYIFSTHAIPLILLGFCVLRRPPPELSRKVQMSIVSWLATVSLAMIALPIGRYLLPAYPALALLVVAGLRNFFSPVNGGRLLIAHVGLAVSIMALLSR